MTDVIRMGSAHLSGVAELERLCFSSPWSERALELYLREGVAFVTLTPSGNVSAYGGLLPSDEEGEIINLAVHPTARRNGLGGAILDALLAESRQRALKVVALEVRVSNAAALALYRSRGFEIAGVRRRFYTAPTEDAYTMIKHLN